MKSNSYQVSPSEISSPYVVTLDSSPLYCVFAGHWLKEHQFTWSREGMKTFLFRDRGPAILFKLLWNDIH